MVTGQWWVRTHHCPLTILLIGCGGSGLGTALSPSFLLAVVGPDSPLPSHHPSYWQWWVRTRHCPLTILLIGSGGSGLITALSPSFLLAVVGPDSPLPSHHPSYWLRLFSNQTFSPINTATFSTPVILHTCPPMKMGQCVPKRRHIKLGRREITQKKAHNVQNTAKV